MYKLSSKGNEKVKVLVFLNILIIYDFGKLIAINFHGKKSQQMQSSFHKDKGLLSTSLKNIFCVCCGVPGDGTRHLPPV